MCIDIKWVIITVLEKIKLHQKKEDIDGIELNRKKVLVIKTIRCFSFKESLEKSFTLKLF